MPNWITPTVVAYVVIGASLVQTLLVHWLTRELRACRAREEMRAKRAEQDPGPLDTDDKLRMALCGPALPSSKTLDRVQDAFERLLREDAELRNATEAYVWCVRVGANETAALERLRCVLGHDLDARPQDPRPVPFEEA